MAARSARRIRPPLPRASRVAQDSRYDIRELIELVERGGDQLDDIATEAVADGLSVLRRLDDFRDGCPACREEHDSLYALVTSTQLL